MAGDFVIDHGMGIKLRWDHRSFLSQELERLRGIELGQVFDWRGILVRVIKIEPFIVEETHA